MTERYIVDDDDDDVTSWRVVCCDLCREPSSPQTLTLGDLFSSLFFSSLSSRFVQSNVVSSRFCRGKDDMLSLMRRRRMVLLEDGIS